MAHECDFLPPEYHEARRLRRALHVRMASIGGMVALMGLWFVVHRHRLAAADAMLREVNGQREQIRIHRVRREGMLEERARLADRRRLIEQVAEPTSLAAALEEMSRNIPETVLLTDLRVQGATLGRFAFGAPKEPPSATAVQPVNPSAAKGSTSPASPPEKARTRLLIKGAAKSTPDILAFAAALEDSPLFDKVQVDTKGADTLGARTVQRFEMTFELSPREGGGR